MKSIRDFFSSLIGSGQTPRHEAESAPPARREVPSAAPDKRGQPKDEAKPAPPARCDTPVPASRKGGRPNNEEKPAEPMRREAPRQDAEELYKKGDVIGGKYMVHSTLGKGGFGVVYRAYDRDTKEVCALKTFRDELLADAAAREAFKKEALLWVNLDRHPYILAAVWVAEVSGRLFVVMDHVAPDAQGRVSLADHLARTDGPLDEQQALKWATQFCLGMEHAQARGIKCHRDIKPANILITQDGTLKISDFGLAAAAELAWRAPGGQTSSLVTGGDAGAFGLSLIHVEGKLRCGTPGYMATEVYRGEGADIRSDIYSFGLVLWQMAVGSRVPPFVPPYRGDLEAYLRETYEQQMSGRVPRVDGSLGPIIERCLRPSPAERYGSFAELRGALEPILEGAAGMKTENPLVGEKTAAFWSNKGGSLATLARHEEALRCYDQALKIDPRNAMIWNNKGSSLAALGRREEAIGCYDQALAIDPRHASAWNNKGESLAALGRIEEAIHCYDEVLAIDPRCTEALNGKGSALATLGRGEEALKCFDQALAIDPRDAKGWYNSGTLFHALGKSDDALKSFDQALAIEPRYAKAWFNKGAILHNLGRRDEARKCFDKAVAIDPQYAKELANKGNAPADSRQRTKNATDWKQEGKALADQKRCEEAVGCFDQALVIDPRDAEVWYYKGTMLQALDRCEEAISCFDRALAINPHDGGAWITKAVLEETSGRRREAALSYRKFIELAPPHLAQFVATARERLAKLESKGI